MSIAPPNGPFNADWQRVAQAFSDADLKPHPDTDDVMSFFSDDAIFSQPPYPDVSKRVAWLGFKLLCEDSALEFRGEPEVSFTHHENHVVWTFSTVQLRKGLLPTWIQSPQWYRIDNEVRLFFSGEGQETKICRYETVRNEWTPIQE